MNPPSVPLSSKNIIIFSLWFCLYQQHRIISCAHVWILESQRDVLGFATKLSCRAAPCCVPKNAAGWYWRTAEHRADLQCRRSGTHTHTHTQWNPDLTWNSTGRVCSVSRSRRRHNTWLLATTWSVVIVLPRLCCFYNCGKPKSKLTLKYG